MQTVVSLETLDFSSSSTFCPGSITGTYSLVDASYFTPFKLKVLVAHPMSFYTLMSYLLTLSPYGTQ